MINTVISHYRIIKKLGEGAMGEVYLAQDTELNRKVALKFLSTQYTSDPAFKARFKREAQAAAALNHPNIVIIHDIGELENRSYIVMEYVEGESLKDLIARQTLPGLGAIDVVMQICAGLCKAHREGVFHRDIKPANILINKDGQVKIVDFGLATLKGSTKLTKAGTMMGTPHYMSPEQVKGETETLDQRSDIFSVGVVFYELLTGKLPFDGDNQLAVLYAIVHNTPAPLAKHRPEVLPSLQKIIDKALNKDIDARYQRMEEFMAELRRERLSLSPAEQSTVTIIASELMRKPKAGTFKRRLWQIGLPAILVLALIFLVMQFLPGRREQKLTNGAAVSATTALSISTQPPGAAVFLNGDSVGVTPANLSTALEGNIAVRMQKPNYLTLDTLVSIIKGQAATFSFPLRPAARIAITVDPADAKVIIDGKPMEPARLANLQLTVGRHNVLVSAEGYQTRQDQLDLVQGMNPSRNYTLERISALPIVTVQPVKPPPATPTLTPLGGLSIKSDPDGATIVLDGQNIGSTTYASQKVKAGPHEIVLQKPGYKDYSTSVIVAQGQVSEVYGKLTTLMGKLSVLIKPYGSIYIDGNLEKRDSNIRYSKDLPAGSHRLRAVHPTLGAWEKSVTIEPDQEAYVEVDFNKQVTLTITSFDESGKPAFAEIYVDNKSTGQITPKQLSLRIGLHTIEVRREGYQLVDEAKILNLEDNVIEPLRFTIRKIQ